MAETYIYATYIRTTPEKLWEALLSPDMSEKYWFGFRFEAEPKAGGRLRMAPPKRWADSSVREGKVLACEPGKKLVYEFVIKDAPEVAEKRKKHGLSRVTYELTPMGPMVKLRLVHENLLPEDIEHDPSLFRGVNNGWPAVMASLKSLLETGREIAFPLKTECGAEPEKAR